MGEFPVPPHFRTLHDAGCNWSFYIADLYNLLDGLEPRLASLASKTNDFITPITINNKGVTKADTVNFGTKTDISNLQDQINANLNAINTETSRATGEENAINAKIPTVASNTNQLADKDFVNSSITHQASNSVYADIAGNQFETRAALLSATTFYRAGAAYVPSNNDYTIVLSDEGAPEPFTGGQTRWKWTGNPAVLGYEFGINETPFTSAQNHAINSGLSAGDKTKLDNIESGAQVNTVNSVAGKTGNVVLNKSDVGLSNVSNTSDADKPVSTAQATAFSGKVDKVNEATSGNLVYGVMDGAQNTYPVVGDGASAWSVARRIGTGQLVATDPTEDRHCATKKYADSKVAQTTAGSRVYVTDANGNQVTVTYTSSASASVIVARGANAQIAVPLVPTDNQHATSKKYVDDKVQSLTSAPVGAIIAMPKDTWPAGYIGCWSDAGINSEGYFANLWNDDYWYASVDLYNYLGTTWGTFTKDGKTYRRMPGYNTDSAFLRGGGGKGAAIGTLQLDAAPNITASALSGHCAFSGANGAFYLSNSGRNYWSYGGGSGNADLNIDASRSSAAYGRASEVRPINYTVFYYLKY